MEQANKQRVFTLLMREIQEYRNSLVLTPLVVAGLLLFSMMVSVLFADRITVVGNSIVDILHDEHANSGLHITISIDEDEEKLVIQQELKPDESGTEQATQETEAELEEWNFSREWTFNPPRKNKHEHREAQIESLNPVLNAVHALFLVLLLFTSGNYLLGTFHQDRRDRSVLFWKSMPVSETQEVAVKMATVCLLAPAIYIGVSILTQLGSVLLTLLLTWRLDMNPTQVVLANINFLSLFRGQLGAWVIWVLFTLPFYSWLLLSSSAAKRSPLMLAIAIPVALMLLELFFFGSSYIDDAIGRHIPHPGDETTTPMGFYFAEPNWLSLDFLGLALGLLAATAFLAATVWFRKHRFEI